MLIDDFIQASICPVVPLWAQYVASLSMTGYKILPTYLIHKTAGIIAPIFEKYDGSELMNLVEQAGFIYEENHCRSEPHETWQANLGHKGLWVIPIDELLIIHYMDKEDFDMVTLIRLFYSGTEKELETAINGLVRS